MLGKELIENGYKSHPVGDFDSSWAKAFFQKEILDDVGTRYFINVYLSMGLPCAEFLDGQAYGKVQFSLRDNGTINMNLFHVDSVQFMEEFYEDVWNKLDLEYYD